MSIGFQSFNSLREVQLDSRFDGLTDYMRGEVNSQSLQTYYGVMHRAEVTTPEYSRSYTLIKPEVGKFIGAHHHTGMLMPLIPSNPNNFLVAGTSKFNLKWVMCIPESDTPRQQGGWGMELLGDDGSYFNSNHYGVIPVVRYVIPLDAPSEFQQTIYLPTLTNGWEYYIGYSSLGAFLSQGSTEAPPWLMGRWSIAGGFLTEDSFKIFTKDAVDMVDFMTPDLWLKSINLTFYKVRTL